MLKGGQVRVTCLLKKRGQRGIVSPLKKRGQVTIFIIIGVLMLFLFAGVLYISKMTVKEKLTTEGEPIVEEVPLEFTAIKAFTENCLHSVGKKGLLILGQQGGYIYPDLLGDFSVSDPTDSAGINLEPTKVPYWHYNVESNRGDKIVFSSWQPKLYYGDDPEMSVEAQLMRFVDEELDNCLGDYAAFREQGFGVEKGMDEVEVRIGESRVGFILRMPLKMEKGKAVGEMNTFYVKIPLKLKHYYEVAEGITKAEYNYSFLERQALDLIQVFSAVDINKLPPTSAVAFELVPTVYWNKLDVEDKLKGMLVSYVPMLRFLRSRNFFRYEYSVTELSDLYQKNYDNMILPLEGGEDLEIDFDYFGWPFYFDINSKGDSIEPQHIAVHYWMLHFGTQHYYTVYDLSYPVLVSLRDPLAFDGEGFDFVFALESNIRNNKPAESGEELLPPVAAFSKSMVCDENKYDTELLKTIVVDSSTGESLEAVQIGFTVPEQDDCVMGLTDSEGGFESEYPAVYGGVMNFIKEGYLTNFYPIDTYKYNEKPEIIGYAVEGYPEEVIELHPFKTINVTVKKKNLEKCLVPLVCEYTSSGVIPGEEAITLNFFPYKDISCEKGDEQCFFNEGSNLFLGEPVASFEANGSLSRYNNYYFTDSVKKLSDTESVVITLKRVGDLNPEVFNEDFITAVNLKGEEVREINLVPGVYEISATLILNEETVIPEEGRCMSYDIITWEKEECFTIGETRTEKFIGGMMEWNTPKTYFRITSEDLYTSDNLEFYLLSQNLKDVPVKIKGESKECAGYACVPFVGCLFEGCDTKEIEINGKVVEDLQVMGQMGNISRMPDVRKALEPRFS